MSTLPKAIYRFSAISIKISVAFFTEIEQTILKFVWNIKGLQITKTILRKKNKAGSIMLPDCKRQLESYSNQNSMVLAKNRYMDQRNRSENPEINPYLYVQLIYDKGGKNIQWGKAVS